jgi:hypothetical protein
MRVSRKSWVVCQIAGAAAAILLSGAGSAWAGDGGDSLQTLQLILSDTTSGLCVTFGINPCPQLPTITQAVLEVAGIENSPPQMVRALNSIPPGCWVDAGNAAALPPITFPLTATTSPTLSSLLSTLTPLAFNSESKPGLSPPGSACPPKPPGSPGTSTATQLYDPGADTFLYAVTSGGSSAELTGLPIPDTAYFFYDDLSRTNQNFKTGQVVGKFLLPLTVLNSDGTERAVAATLQFIAPTIDCSASTVSGDFLTPGTVQTGIKATDIGLKCAVVFGPSPASSDKHAVFEVAIKLVVIQSQGTPPQTPDLTYFWFAATGLTGPVNLGIPSAFFPPNETGFTPTKSGILPAGASIGIAPSAGPLGPPPPSGVASTFALCANLPRNGNGQPLVPSVTADYAIATSGETLLSAPLPSVSTTTCPF